MYRVDRRTYILGQAITPPPESYHEGAGFDDKGRKIEGVLTSGKPDNIGIQRRDALFLFVSLSDAINFMRNMTDSKLYHVRPNEQTIPYHRGDMNYTEMMNDLIENDDALEKISRLYWSGRRTNKPCWEILTNQVTVVEIISNDETSRRAISGEHHTANGNIERVPFYINTIARLNLPQGDAEG